MLGFASPWADGRWTAVARASKYGSVMLKPGDKAPTFTLLNQAGEKVKLGDFKGRKVLVYFYPES